MKYTSQIGQVGKHWTCFENAGTQTVSYEVGIKYKIKWFSVPVEIPMLDVSIGISEEATYTDIISVTGRCCRDSN